MILVDGAFLAAVLDRSDRHHRRCVSALEGVQEPLATTWPVLDDTFERLSGLHEGRDAVWELLERAVVRLLSLDSEDAPRLRELTRGSRGLKLAQASLVRVAERDGLEGVLALDRVVRRRRIKGRLLFRRALPRLP